MDANSFAQFFQWVSASVAQTSVSVGAVSNNDLPPPPDEINIVLWEKLCAAYLFILSLIFLKV